MVSSAIFERAIAGARGPECSRSRAARPSLRAAELAANVNSVTEVNEFSRAIDVDPRDTGARGPAGQPVCTSVPSPDHRVWKTPALSTRW